MQYISLTLSWRRSLSCRNHSNDLLCKSVDWFLYDGDLRHERVKVSLRHREDLCILDLKESKCDKKSLDNLVDGCNHHDLSVSKIRYSPVSFLYNLISSPIFLHCYCCWYHFLQHVLLVYGTLLGAGSSVINCNLWDGSLKTANIFL